MHLLQQKRRVKKKKKKKRKGKIRWMLEEKTTIEGCGQEKE